MCLFYVYMYIYLIDQLIEKQFLWTKINGKSYIQ